ncbi:MAG: hypothetical protein RJQ21_09845 [Rhodospirillales bacterium]
MRCLTLFLALILPLPALADFEADRATEAARFAEEMQHCGAEDEEACSASFYNACGDRHDWTTVAMMLCAAAQNDYWTRKADEYWRDILPRASGDFRRHLEELASARESWRALECSTYGYFDGTMWRPVASSCAADSSRRWLVLLRETWEAGPLAAIPDEIDLDCDGTPDKVFARPPEKGQIRIDFMPGGTAPVETIITLDIDSTKQIALCGEFVELETVTPPGACQKLRISDGMCDSVYLQRDKNAGQWIVQRN